jgi:type IV secretory pathway VirB10-like protein
LDLGAMPGADGQGEAGFHDQVDNHFIRLFGSALLMSAITGGITYSQNQGQGNNNNFNGNPARLSHLIFVSVRTETVEAPDFDITNLNPFRS